MDSVNWYVHCSKGKGREFTPFPSVSVRRQRREAYCLAKCPRLYSNTNYALTCLADIPIQDNNKLRTGLYSDVAVKYSDVS